MYIDTQTIITAAAVLTAICTILAALFKAHKWYLKQEKQDKELQRMKEENSIICYVLIAALDGLQQLGANGPVTEAKEKLEKHLNALAHK